MSKCIVSVEEVQKVLNFIVSQPYKNVHSLVPMVMAWGNNLEPEKKKEENVVENGNS